MRTILAIVFASSLALPSLATAQDAAKAGAKSAGPVQTKVKAGKGEKVCRHKFPDGTPKVWVCKSDDPCCAWDEIRYVKCGSPTFRCL